MLLLASFPGCHVQYVTGSWGEPGKRLDTTTTLRSMVNLITVYIPSIIAC